MFNTPAVARTSIPGCATIIPTRRMSLRASIERLRGRAINAIAAWRRDRHDARYLGYLSEIELREIGLSRSALRNMGIHTRSAHQSDQDRFPF